jgi:hypothetical protein
MKKDECKMKEPSFKVRGFNLCESILRHTPDQLRNFIRRMKHLQMNTLIVHYDYGWIRYKELILEETLKAGVEITLMTFGPRTFFSFTDWKPEWFAKQEEGSPFSSELECETHPCRYQPEGLEAFAFGAKQWLKSLPPQIKRVHMRAADGLHFCRCEKCRNLSDHEKWQPFVEKFVKAVFECRPDLEFETDIYVKRYNIPQNVSAHKKMHRIMYDTFYRHPHVPIGGESPNREAVYYAATEANPDATSPNQYHYNRLRDWCKCTAGKVYIHENAMGQALQGVFQHNTGVMLKDLHLYKQLGVQGVCYEAYEPGYSGFAENFEILAKAMLDLDSAKDYQPSELEQILRENPKMNCFCDDLKFPLRNYFSNSVELQHIEYFRQGFSASLPDTYRDYVKFAFEHEERFDPLFIGFFNAKWGEYKGALDFSRGSDEARYMLNHNKLWDFMEKIHLDKDPVKECKKLIFDLRENVLAAK